MTGVVLTSDRSRDVALKAMAKLNRSQMQGLIRPGRAKKSSCRELDVAR
jgi:hypothetical protein